MSSKSIDTLSADHLAIGDELCSFRPSKGPLAVFPTFDPSPRHFTDCGMDVDFNHDVPMRDGVQLRADIFRPTGSSGNLPVVLAITPYGKQNPFDVSSIPPSRDFDAGFDGVVQSKYAPFEGTDPVFWTKQGFAYVIVDARGSFASEGDKANFVSKADGVDAYDAIEYFGVRPWSNGRVGMIGASALGAIQWQAASFRPPHLCGILVQDGYTDLYRELAFKGGVPHLNFMALLDNMYRSHGNREGGPVMDLTKGCEDHPYDDDFWRFLSSDPEKITCPLYIVSSLADNGLHTPGTIRGWLAAQSEIKFLELHPYLKWEWQLTPESMERQAAFFHRVLHGPDQRAAESAALWPKVRLHVSEKHYAGSWRSEDDYPLPSTVRTKFHLAADGHLSPTGAAEEGEVQYDAVSGSAAWQVTFSEPTEITGSSRLHLSFAVAGDAHDADIFVTLQKRDRNGALVVFPYHTFINDGHVAYGWLRASKRKPSSHRYGDEVAHTFREEDVEWLTPHTPVHLDINIQPTATLFRKGETLRLVVQGRDFGEYGPHSQIPRAGTGCNTSGRHCVLLHDSYLELPIIPRNV